MAKVFYARLVTDLPLDKCDIANTLEWEMIQTRRDMVVNGKCLDAGVLDVTVWDSLEELKADVASGWVVDDPVKPVTYERWVITGKGGKET